MFPPLLWNSHQIDVEVGGMTLMINILEQNCPWLKYLKIVMGEEIK